MHRNKITWLFTTESRDVMASQNNSMLLQRAGYVKFGTNQSHLYSRYFCLSFEIWTCIMVHASALDIHRRSLTFCAIFDSIPVTHGRAETTISIVPLIPAGNSQEISSETNCKHRLRILQIVMHFTISPTSRLQMLPIYVWESSCNILYNTATRDISKHSWNTDVQLYV